MRKMISVLIVIVMLLPLIPAKVFSDEIMNIRDSSMDYTPYTQLFGKARQLLPTEGALQPFNYSVPASGATVIVFFGAETAKNPRGCGRSDSFIQQLQNVSWSKKDNIEIIGMEVTGASKEETLDYISKYDKSGTFDKVYYNSDQAYAPYWYKILVEHNGDMSGVTNIGGSLSTPFVLIVTAEGGRKNIRFALEGVESMQVVTNALSTCVDLIDGSVKLIEVDVPGTMRFDNVEEVFAATNENRRENGIASLTLSKQLTALAMQRAVECSLLFDEEHTRPNGFSGLTIDEEGTYVTGRVSAENISFGRTSGRETVTGWMNSPGHRANILYSGYTQIGIGCFENNGAIYWVQLFGTGNDRSSTVSGSATSGVYTVKALESNLNLVFDSNQIQVLIGQTTVIPFLYNVNKGIIATRTVIYPEIESVRDSSGQYIASFLRSGLEPGQMAISAISPGSGTAYIKAGKGAENSIKVPVTVSDSYTIGGKTYHAAKSYNGSFTYNSDLDKKNGITYNYSYRDQWFYSSSYKYNHGLTKMSLRIALAAFGAEGTKSTDKNIRKLMEDLDFDNIVSHYPVPKTAGNDTIGYEMGSKNITNNAGESCSVILIAIRGGGYFEEWGENFRVGLGVNHEGFDRAAKIVLKGLEDYLVDNMSKLDGNIKIWVTGYSRGAATANLVASYLALGTPAAFNPGNIFAFCFECPQTTINTNASDFGFIVNIVNPIDTVTKVAPSFWGYRRYGKTYYLPHGGFLSNKSENSLKPRMIEEYKKIINGKHIDIDDLIPDSSTEKILSGEALVTLFAMCQSRELYFLLAQDNAISLMKSIFGSESYSEDDGSSSLLNELLIKLLTRLSDYMNVPLDKIVVYLKEEILEGIIHSHYPELCLAWLDALDGRTAEETYLLFIRKLWVNCPVDVSVYDSKGKLVAEIKDDTVSDIKGGLFAQIDLDGQKVVYLPNDEEYTVSLSATDSGTVTYTIAESEIEGRNSNKIVSYQKIEIQPGDNLTGTVENILNGEDAQYPLELNEIELDASFVSEGGENGLNTVTVCASGNGKVFGGGKHITGEYAKVTAEPDEGEEFLGWYIGGEKVSEDPEYRFLVDDTFVITGSFTENIPRVHVCPSAHLKDVKTDDWFHEYVDYVVENGLMKGVSADRFAPDETTTRAMIVTILYRLEGEPFIGETNPFKDVPSGEWYTSAVKWANDKGIVSGYGNGKFGPNDTITREQFAAIMFRYANYRGFSTGERGDVSGYKDQGAISDWAIESMKWANKVGLITGRSATELAPDGNATRAEAATILTRFIKMLG